MKMYEDFSLNDTLWYSVMKYHRHRDKNLANAGKYDKKKSESRWVIANGLYSNIMFFEEPYDQINLETITEKSNKK
jgi:hypothetical protein